MKEHKKLYLKLVSKMMLHFVWGHLSRKQTVPPSELTTKSAIKFHQIQVDLVCRSKLNLAMDWSVLVCRVSFYVKLFVDTNQLVPKSTKWLT